MRKRVGGMPIKKVGAILLTVMAIALIFAATQTQFDTIVTGFFDNVEYPET